MGESSNISILISPPQQQLRKMFPTNVISVFVNTKKKRTKKKRTRIQKEPCLSQTSNNLICPSMKAFKEQH